ncbi:MAG: GNAT family N-acetyltransferase [Oscillospiraceae bacterium]|nr:GNAT family N-acetyltransferase [Oscillospiraceae bacterium]
MNITYRKANMSDLNAIHGLVRRAVENMIESGIYQWDELYPTRDDFKTDIENDQLYVGTADSKIAVVFVINKISDPEYDDAEWSYTGENYRVIHRLCVDPDFQRSGIARNTMLYIEELLKSWVVESIRLDTFTQNPRALNLYGNLGFKTRGYADWRKGRFVLLEKII